MPVTNRAHPRFWEDQRYALVGLRKAVEACVETLDLPQSATVVDLGAGDAPYRYIFEQRGCEYIACDLGDDADIAILPGTPVPLPDATADLVVSFQVLEHVWDVEWYLSECRRLLKPGGRLILSTHGVWLYHPHPTDYHRWTRDGLLEQLRCSTFTPISCAAQVGPLAWPLLFYLIGFNEALRPLRALRGLVFFPVGLLVNALLPVLDAITPQKIRDDNASTYLTLSSGTS